MSLSTRLLKDDSCFIMLYNIRVLTYRIHYSPQVLSVFIVDGRLATETGHCPVVIWSAGATYTSWRESCETASVGYVCLKHERQAERAGNKRPS